MGGLALSAWRYPRSTRDVDLLIGIGQHQPAELIDTLATAGLTTRHVPPVRQLGELKLLQLEFEPPGTFISIAVDLLLVDSEYHQHALSRCVQLTLEPMARPIAVLSCEDLVLHKLLAGRIIDLSDAAALLRLNRGTVDIAYLKSWSGKLGVESDFAKVSLEAFGQPGP